MFQLVVAVFSVALIAALAICLLWYGGSSFLTGTDKARYAQYMNSGSQIEGAIKMYQNQRGFTPEGNSKDIVPMLVEGDSKDTYLSSSPQGTWYVEQGTIYKALDQGVDECRRINIVAKGAEAVAALTSNGGDGCPVCDNADYRDWPGCKRDSLATAGGNGSGTGTGTGSGG